MNAEPTRDRRVIVSITRPHPTDPEGEFDVEQTYMVNLSGDHVRPWLTRTIFWANNQHFGFLVEPYRGPEAEWVEFRPKPQRTEDSPVGRRQASRDRTFTNR